MSQYYAQLIGFFAVLTIAVIDYFIVVDVSLSILYLFNDRFGHNTGDKLLRIIAQTTQNNIRETDTVARLGGDEFVLLLPETHYKAGESVLYRLQHELMIAIEAYSPPVSLSIGAVTFLSLPNSIEQMLEEVDILMYQVKKSGKNRLEHQVFDRSNSSV